MKNVFLITWFVSENYGTCLQAYATKTALSTYSYVKVLDRRRYYSIDKLNFLLNKLCAVFKSKLRKREQPFDLGKFGEAHNRKLLKIKALADENYNAISINSSADLKEIDAWVDCYLVGSDQMWSPWMLSPHYLLDFVPKKSKKPKYSYAASFGVDNIPADKRKLYKKYLPQFDKITVREPRAAELVKELCGREATVVLDPTFLLTQDEWRQFSLKSSSVKEHDLSDYILCYFIGSPEFDHLKTVQELADNLGLKVALLPTKESDYHVDEPNVKIIADACAYDFVSLIDNAKLVCTDSFHAVVFSFLMGTALYTFPRFKKGDKYSQESRLLNIMTKFKLMDSVWNENKNTDEIRHHMSADYSEGYAVLEREREECKELLQKMIEGIEE